MASLRLPKQRTMVAPAATWKRVASFIADLFVIELTLLGPFQSYFSSWFSSMQPAWSSMMQQDLALPAGFMAAVGFIGVLALLYFSLFEYYLGATPGMLIFQLQVGGERTLWKCLVRNAFILPFFPFTALWITEPLFLALRKERLLERWSRTATVQTIII